MSYPQIGAEQNNPCVVPVANATNFTSANSTIYSMLVNHAKYDPYYPLDAGSNSNEIRTYQTGVLTFATLNQQTSTIKALNVASTLTMPYPRFRSESERIQYVYGQAMTSARNRMTGQNPSLPAGVACSTIFQISQ